MQADGPLVLGDSRSGQDEWKWAMAARAELVEAFFLVILTK